MDFTDKTLISLLQRDTTLSLDELAKRTGSTKTPIWNRIKKLKQRGIIRREVALCDPEALGLSACFYSRANQRTRCAMAATVLERGARAT